MLMIKESKSETGSRTAKGGFINEVDVCDKFIDYKNDDEAKAWLSTMGYQPRKIQKIVATQIPVRINCEKACSFGISKEKYAETIQFKKADIQVRVEIVMDDIIYAENISLKKSNKSAGFNQVDKRPVSTYKQIWKFSDDIEKWLRLFTGDVLPEKALPRKELQGLKDKRRLFLNEMPPRKARAIVRFFQGNKSLILSDILRGRGGLSAEWFLVTRQNEDDSTDWVLKDINTVCNFYSQGNVTISPKGSLKIGRVTMQRKGGTPDPASLQFKINPLDLF